MTTTLQKWGNSQGIRIPKIILDTVHWAENEQIVILIENDNIIIKKANNKKRKNIKELFANYKGDYTPTEIDWGKPEGDEVW